MCNGVRKAKKRCYIEYCGRQLLHSFGVFRSDCTRDTHLLLYVSYPNVVDLKLCIHKTFCWIQKRLKVTLNT
jgi:hypothetical protein